MAARAQEDARRRGVCLLLFVVFFVFVVIIIVNEVAIFPGLDFVFLVVLFVRVIGDEVQVDGMRLRDLEFGFALRTTQDLAFFDFVFVDIDFGGTFRATDHGSTLRTVVCKVGVRGPRPPLCSVLYTAAHEVNSRPWGHCFERHRFMGRRTFRMASSREYPERPVVGIGGVIIDQGRTLLIRRGSEPLLGEWSIPGGTLEIGESLEEGVARELLEETGIEVRVIELIEVFDRIYREGGSTGVEVNGRPRFHFVIADYLCERLGGEPRAGSDVTDVAFAREEELARFHLTETATRVLKKAFAMDRARRAAK
jgi:8-oxo-dGTP diphosphatase